MLSLSTISPHLEYVLDQLEKIIGALDQEEIKHDNNPTQKTV